MKKGKSQVGISQGIKLCCGNIGTKGIFTQFLLKGSFKLLENVRYLCRKVEWFLNLCWCFGEWNNLNQRILKYHCVLDIYLGIIFRNIDQTPTNDLIHTNFLSLCTPENGKLNSSVENTVVLQYAHVFIFCQLVKQQKFEST